MKQKALVSISTGMFVSLCFHGFLFYGLWTKTDFIGIAFAPSVWVDLRILNHRTEFSGPSRMMVQKIPRKIKEDAPLDLGLRAKDSIVRDSDEGEGPVGVSEDQVLKKVPVRYPAFARIKRLTGSVVTQLLIDLEGRVSRVEVLQASSAVFIEEAIRALGGYHFSRAFAGKRIKYQLDFVLD